jgi:hypothetical protein
MMATPSLIVDVDQLLIDYRRWLAPRLDGCQARRIPFSADR